MECAEERQLVPIEATDEYIEVLTDKNGRKLEYWEIVEKVSLGVDKWYFRVKDSRPAARTYRSYRGELKLSCDNPGNLSVIYSIAMGMLKSEQRRYTSFDSIQKHRHHFAHFCSTKKLNQSTMKTLLRMTFHHLEWINKLGEGTYGEVWHANHAIIGEVAAKRFKRGGNNVSSHAWRERDMLIYLKDSPHVVQIFGAFYGADPYILMELGTDTLVRMEHKRFDTKNAARYSYQLMLGVKYLHDRNIIHCDLKPQNCIISSKNILLIGDFGSAQLLSDKYPVVKSKEPLGSLGYMDLEANAELRFSKRTDVFSIACIIFELFTGNFLLMEPLINERSVYADRIKNGITITTPFGLIITDTLEKKCSRVEKFGNLLCSMIKEPSKDRLTIDEVINYDSLSEILVHFGTSKESTLEFVPATVRFTRAPKRQKHTGPSNKHNTHSIESEVFCNFYYDFEPTVCDFESMYTEPIPKSTNPVPNENLRYNGLSVSELTNRVLKSKAMEAFFLDAGKQFVDVIDSICSERNEGNNNMMNVLPVADTTSFQEHEIQPSGASDVGKGDKKNINSDNEMMQHVDEDMIEVVGETQEVVLDPDEHINQYVPVAADESKEGGTLEFPKKHLKQGIKEEIPGFIKTANPKVATSSPNPQDDGKQSKKIKSGRTLRSAPKVSTTVIKELEEQPESSKNVKTITKRPARSKQTASKAKSSLSGEAISVVSNKSEIVPEKNVQKSDKAHSDHDHDDDDDDDDDDDFIVPVSKVRDDKKKTSENPKSRFPPIGKTRAKQSKTLGVDDGKDHESAPCDDDNPVNNKKKPKFSKEKKRQLSSDEDDSKPLATLKKIRSIKSEPLDKSFSKKKGINCYVSGCDEIHASKDEAKAHMALVFNSASKDEKAKMKALAKEKEAKKIKKKLERSANLDLEN